MNKRSNALLSGAAVRPTLLLSLTFAAVLGVAAAADDPHAALAHHANAVSAKLIDVVRLATRPYLDVNAATAAGYQPAFGCISGPDHGAMGVHYINGGLVADGQIDGAHPEAMIYEPTKNGMQLVGVEYIVDAATWMAHNSAPPVLEGQGFQLVSSPNRYGLQPFFELHVWAWRDNPNGAFVDWNNQVNCEGR